MVLYTLDPTLAATDPVKAKQALQAALNVTNANVLISQEADEDVNYVTLAEDVIPELSIFDYSVGAPFMTPRFPHLRVCIQTGFDQDDKAGWLPLRQMVVPSNNLDSFVTTPPTADTPLAGELELKDGIPVAASKVHSHKAVMQSNMWPTYASILNKDFHQVEGVGVVF